MDNTQQEGIYATVQVRALAVVVTSDGQLQDAYYEEFYPLSELIALGRNGQQDIVNEVLATFDKELAKDIEDGKVITASDCFIDDAIITSSSLHESQPASSTYDLTKDYKLVDQSLITSNEDALLIREFRHTNDWINRQNLKD